MKYLTSFEKLRLGWTLFHPCRLKTILLDNNNTIRITIFELLLLLIFIVEMFALYDVLWVQEFGTVTSEEFIAATVE